LKFAEKRTSASGSAGRPIPAAEIPPSDSNDGMEVSHHSEIVSETPDEPRDAEMGKFTYCHDFFPIYLNFKLFLSRETCS
jgi:hypothetical protein